MNYDELVAQGDRAGDSGAMMPIGMLYSTQVEGSYANKVEVRGELWQRDGFAECLRRECDANSMLSIDGQIHFAPDDSIPPQLELERGRYLTFRQLMETNPSLLGNRRFIHDTLEALFDIAEALNKRDVYHLCFHPGNVLVRKGDNRLMLLSHGSFYLPLSDRQAFYGDMSDYVAPEVVGGGEVGAWSEVYSIGKFIEWLYSMARMPMEVRMAVKRATREEPSKRYQSVAIMRQALKKTGAMRRQGVAVGIATIVALAIVALYFYVVPEPVDVEYVKPVEEVADDDGMEAEINIERELGIIGKDSIDSITPEQRKAVDDYQKKAEEIFKKRFEKEADRILSRVYNNDYMGASEKTFMAESRSVTEELMRVERQIADEADLAESRSQRLASEIIERLTEEKKSELKKYGIQK